MMNQLKVDDANFNKLEAIAIFYKEGATMTFLDKKTKIDRV